MKPEDCYLELPFLNFSKEEALEYFAPNLNPKALPLRHYRWNIPSQKILAFPFVSDFSARTGIEISKVALFSLGPNMQSTVHNERGLDVDSAINVTIYGGPRSNVMRWFDIPERSECGHIVDAALLDNLKPNVELVFEHPTLININHWHQVMNASTESHRIVLTMRFRGNPSFEECKTIISRTYSL